MARKRGFEDAYRAMVAAGEGVRKRAEARREMARWARTAAELHKAGKLAEARRALAKADKWRAICEPSSRR